MRVRYETYCGGRLLKVTEQLDVTSLGDHAAAGSAPADGLRFADGSHYWMIDEQRVAEDVARAVQAKWVADHRPQ